MITNFEAITTELTDEELRLLPALLLGFKNHDKKTPIKAPEIVAAMNKYIDKVGMKIKFSEVRLRKFVNHIRKHSILPLIATSEGYYISFETIELQKQIQSLRERANSILECAYGLEKIQDKF